MCVLGEGRLGGCLDLELVPNPFQPLAPCFADDLWWYPPNWIPGMFTAPMHDFHQLVFLISRLF